MNVLDVQHLRKVFRSSKGDVEAVRGISLQIDAGEVLAFLGPNGAGKTTTIKMIAGLIRPDAGTVRVTGRDPHRDRGAVAAIGAVLEGNRNVYWRLTPQQNLSYFGMLRGLSRREALQRSSELLARFDLLDKRDAPVRGLSRGMQQKLAIAVALIHRPRLLLLDEPTLGLDVEAAERVKLLIPEVAAEGAAVLLTTHQLGVAEEIATRVAIINGGAIVAEDTTAHLLDTFAGEVYQVSVGGQIGVRQRDHLIALGARLTEGRVEYLGDPEGLYRVFDVLHPLPILKVDRDRTNLTGVFLRLVREVQHA